MNDNAQKLSGMLLAHVMAFPHESECDPSVDKLVEVEVTDVGGGFTEIAFDHDGDRIYVRFRDVSLNHARNDKT